MRTGLYLFIFPLILIFFACAIARSDSTKPWALLDARIGGQAVWTLKLQPMNKGCEAVLKDTSQAASERRQALEKAQCEELYALLPQAAKDLLRHALEKPHVIADEPAYDLKIGSAKASVAFKAPEVCEIQSNGDLRCKKVERSSAERMLFVMRNTASFLRQDGK